MRLLFHHRIASSDGQFVHLTELTNALIAQGHNVLIIGPKIKNSVAVGQTRPLVSALKRLLPAYVYEVLELCYSFIATVKLFIAALKFRPEVIYERYNLHLHAGRFVARAMRVPYLLEVNAPLTDERLEYGGLRLAKLARWSDRTIWRSADIALPVTDVLADFLRAVGVREKQIRVIHNGADLALYPDSVNREELQTVLGIPKNHIVLGFVGFIRAWHGLHKIVDYMAQHPEQPVYLLLVGDGAKDKDDLLDQVKRLGLDNRVKLTGFVSRDQVPQLIQAFDIALQPASTSYASPLKLFEYMAAGCAVIAPNAANIREVLSDGENAVLFEESDERAIVIALDRLVSDTRLRHSLGLQARNRILGGQFTWKGNADLVVSLATQLIEERKKTR